MGVFRTSMWMISFYSLVVIQTRKRFTFARTLRHVLRDALDFLQAQPSAMELDSNELGNDAYPTQPVSCGDAIKMQANHCLAKHAAEYRIQGRRLHPCCPYVTPLYPVVGIVK